MKRFDDWNDEKKKIQSNYSHNNTFFYAREVWWIKMGQNIGVEENGKGPNFLRPVLILRKHNRNCFVGLPLTSNNKDHPFYFTFVCDNNLTSAILSQIRLFDCKRLYLKIDTMKQEEFAEIKNAVAIINLGKPLS